MPLSLKPTQTVKLTQSLRLTPQMQLALKIQQLNNLQLDVFIGCEIEENPFIERDEKVRSQSNDETPSPSSARNDTNDTMASDMQMAPAFMGEPVVDARAHENIWDSDRAASHISSGQVIEKSVAVPETLQAHLEKQIYEDIRTPFERTMCLALVNWLDDDGYLRDSDESLCACLGCTKLQLEEALRQLRDLTPVGVFARSLPDCLMLQAQKSMYWSPELGVLIEHLDAVGRADFKNLARICAVSLSRLEELIATLRLFIPKPGVAFLSGDAVGKSPDIIVSKTEKGWQVALNESTLPKILVLDRYWEELSRRPVSDETRNYLAKNLQSGKWIRRAMQQRAATMLQVMREILNRQYGYFEKGISHLKPMVLREIGEALNLHESTISRVVANKLVETPFGVFELKSFFSAALNASQNTNGARQKSHSARAVKARIKDLIVAETQAKILSDDAIVALLEKEGVDIARRTVAKYREAMNIPASGVRRRQARLENRR